jgi:hypothetical protein
VLLISRYLENVLFVYSRHLNLSIAKEYEDFQIRATFLGSVTFRREDLNFILNFRPQAHLFFSFFSYGIIHLLTEIGSTPGGDSSVHIYS